MQQPPPPDTSFPQPPNRRQWLQGLGALGLAANFGTTAHAQTLAMAPWPVSEQLFGLGVASGEPDASSVVLWTRLLPSSHAPLLRPQTVHWELAHDAQFHQIVRQGEAMATPDGGHSVHVLAQGLEAERWYYYRFHCQGQTSATGRTRTAPAAGAAVAQLRLVYASCQRWEHGYYAAWRHAREDDPDLVVFLGDYIYEYASPKSPAKQKRSQLARLQPLAYPVSLQDYRDRYALHKSDPDLQAMHAHCPWLVTWDDHEVEDNYVGDYGVGKVQAFAAKRLAAYQAFYENMPLRASIAYKQAGLAMPAAGTPLYRQQSWGALAELWVLDARQYRDLQACRAPMGKSPASVKAADCADLASDRRSFLGWSQERWLAGQLAGNSAAKPESRRWSVICQQTLFAERAFPSGRTSADTWDGYPAARQRLLRAIGQAQLRNTVLLGGDIHQNYVCRIHDPEAAKPEQVLASEFCGTSISAHSGTTQARVDAIVAHNPHVLLARCDERGYGLCDISPKLWTTQLRVVNQPQYADSAAHTLARFVVEDQVAGPQWA
ncbi:alkaline phosphatase D [Comamonas sp. BIGb0152]|uniref:alkaline phosphatase D family protein n=1 Tax=Comamonas sp. BIGb0152 TaxID=2940601 RepID=UPI002169F065|nr:alkaline phosphatase D family protein [Comamonas sp. BIGb0152]MCS4295611.1 alkaline phosphatase D [Comamonas sp. BIGb0152]